MIYFYVLIQGRTLKEIEYIYCRIHASQQKHKNKDILHFRIEKKQMCA